MRVVCYCIDCQTYAHHLGRPDEILDAAGGTEVVQTSPSRISLEAGHEHLRCLRQSLKGALRWYAGCCGTPLVNGVENASVPFVGVVHTFLRFEDAAAREAALGAPRGALATKDAQGAPLHPRARLLELARLLKRMGVAYLRGEQRPSPFRDEKDQPLGIAEQMDKETRNRLRAHLRRGR